LCITADPTLQLTWPENEESVDSQPVLQWEAFPGAVSYHIVVLDDAAFPPLVALDQTVTEPMLAVDQPLAPGHSVGRSGRRMGKRPFSLNSTALSSSRMFWNRSPRRMALLSVWNRCCNGKVTPAQSGIRSSW
ncbi:MAG: hypothetical protein R6X34_19795, partial [Chloroflexota bacterium]